MLSFPDKSNEPSFLRKLRSQYGEGGDNHRGRPNPRPVKPRDANDDDEPTYVDEESNEVISTEQYLALLKGDAQEEAGDTNGKSAKDGAVDKAETRPLSSKPSKGAAEIGGSKKRKQGKIIGEEEKPEENPISQRAADEPKKKKKVTKKKIKLSFDEE